MLHYVHQQVDNSVCLPFGARRYIGRYYQKPSTELVVVELRCRSCRLQVLTGRGRIKLKRRYLLFSFTDFNTLKYFNTVNCESDSVSLFGQVRTDLDDWAVSRLWSGYSLFLSSLATRQIKLSTLTPDTTACILCPTNGQHWFLLTMNTVFPYSRLSRISFLNHTRKHLFILGVNRSEIAHMDLFLDSNEKIPLLSFRW